MTNGETDCCKLLLLLYVLLQYNMYRYVLPYTRGSTSSFPVGTAPTHDLTPTDSDHRLHIFRLLVSYITDGETRTSR